MTTTASGASLQVVRGLPESAPTAGLAPFSLPAGPPSHQETVEDLLRQSARELLPLRKSFVQRPRGASTRPGPLAHFVGAHDERGLDLYLFIHALASSEPWTCAYPSSTWARVLDLASTCETASAQSAVSKALTRLQQRGLIERGPREHRRAVVRLLHEDGSGRDYTRPTTGADPWLVLPYSYWRLGHHQRLSLPGKAMLLVALSLTETFVLPQERVPTWYGWSADTAGAGLQQLRDLGVLTTTSRYEVDHKSFTGWREEQHHQLTGPYAVSARRAAGRGRRRKKPSDSTTSEAAVTA